MLSPSWDHDFHELRDRVGSALLDHGRVDERILIDGRLRAELRQRVAFGPLVALGKSLSASPEKTRALVHIRAMGARFGGTLAAP